MGENKFSHLQNTESFFSLDKIKRMIPMRQKEFSLQNSEHISSQELMSKVSHQALLAYKDNVWLWRIIVCMVALYLTLWIWTNQENDFFV